MIPTPPQKPLPSRNISAQELLRASESREAVLKQQQGALQEALARRDAELSGRSEQLLDLVMQTLSRASTRVDALGNRLEGIVQQQEPTGGAGGGASEERGPRSPSRHRTHRHHGADHDAARVKASREEQSMPRPVIQVNLNARLSPGAGGDADAGERAARHGGAGARGRAGYRDRAVRAGRGGRGGTGRGSG